MIDWVEVTAVATALSTIALAATGLFILLQLRHQGEEQFVSATTGLFQVWEAKNLAC